MEAVHDIATGEPTESELIRRAFGDVVERRRKEAGFKQRMFARVVGISNSHLRSIEQGKVSPTLVTIFKLAATLEADPSGMIEETIELVEQFRELPRTTIEYRSVEP